MRPLIWSPGFERSLKRLIRRKPDLLPRVERTLNLLVEDPFHPTPHTHKLKGDPAGSWACAVDFDYRIIFEFVHDPNAYEEFHFEPVQPKEMRVESP